MSPTNSSLYCTPFSCTMHPFMFTVVVCLLLLKMLDFVCFSRRVGDVCAYIVGVRNHCLCVVLFTVNTLFVAALVCCMSLLSGGGFSVWYASLCADFAVAVCFSWYTVRVGIVVMKVISLLCDVLYHYWNIPFDIVNAVAVLSFSKKDQSTVCTCFWFVVVTAFGGGVAVTFGLVIVEKHKLSFNLNACPLMHCIVCGGNDGGSKASLLVHPSRNIQKCNDSTFRKRKICSVGKENCSEGGQPPQKRGRPGKLSSEHKCGEYAIWLQSGSNEDLKHHHNMHKQIRHAGDKAVSFSSYVSCNGSYSIALREDSCLCNACYQDCLRPHGKPRWLSLSKYLVCKHCMLCCQGISHCACDGIVEWGPAQWYQSEDELKSWVHYFRLSGMSVADRSKHLCKSHYVSVRKITCSRSCKACSSESSDLWHVGKTVLDAMDSPASECECSDLDWVCDGCYTSLVYPKPGRKPCKFHKVRIDVLENCLLQLEQKGACTIKDAMVLYKHTISDNYNDAIGDRECASFRKILKAQLQCRGYKCHYPCKQSGSMYYNDFDR